MKNKLLITSAIIAATTSFSQSSLATNGDTLIGLGAISRAMGGTGIAHFSGAESALKNPAILLKQQGLEVMFGGTFFSPDVSVEKSGSDHDISASSDATANMIPEVAIAHTLDNGMVIGVGMFGSAGMGTDWRDSAPLIGPLTDTATDQLGLYSMRSNLLLLKFAIPLAYGRDNWAIGIAPVLQYGALDLAFISPNRIPAPPFPLNNPSTKQIGQGSSYDFGFGFDLGFAYDIRHTDITLGLVYETAIDMTYDHQISNAAGAFGYGTPGALANFSDSLEQPAQIGVGINWSNEQMSVTFDVKNILWGDAKGYKDFGWQDQTVYALGAEYLLGKLSLRFGYNYAENPIKNNRDSTLVSPAAAPTNGDVLNTFNHIMFPAITEAHYTAGFGYIFSQQVELDIALTYATSPDVTVSTVTTGLGNITVSNNQTALTGAIKYHF